MGDPAGFMKWAREAPHKRPVAERTRDFRELTLPLTGEAATHQSGRCMDCGVPFCHQGCPLGNLIPDFNAAVNAGRWREAYRVLASTNDFPEFTGRLCPAPCESSCVLAIDREPVTIEAIEKEIIERAFASGWVVPQVPSIRTGKTVAVVGSGPAGLAAAARLNQAGHLVTVFERDERPGGLLRFGIPDFKIEKSIVDRRLALLEAEGIVFRTGVEVGKAPGWAELRERFDAVVIAIGAQQARALSVDGAELRGVVQAMDYLSAQNRQIAGGAFTPISADGKRVVILGGGDTGSDCLGTAHRQGAREVRQIELLPSPPGARTAPNPWPQWPLVFRTSSSQEEGGDRLFARRTTRLEGEGGRLTAIHWVGVTSQDGRLVDLPGTEARHPVDLLIQAMGFSGPCTDPLVAQLGVGLDPKGNLSVGFDRQTSVPGVFAAGDAMRGASLIVWAISDGRELARHVDAFLLGRPSSLPTRGIDRPFQPGR